MRRDPTERYESAGAMAAELLGDERDDDAPATEAIPGPIAPDVDTEPDGHETVPIPRMERTARLPSQPSTSPPAGSLRPPLAGRSDRRRCDRRPRPAGDPRAHALHRPDAPGRTEPAARRSRHHSMTRCASSRTRCSCGGDPRSPSASSRSWRAPAVARSSRSSPPRWRTAWPVIRILAESGRPGLARTELRKLVELVVSRLDAGRLDDGRATASSRQRRRWTSS